MSTKTTNEPVKHEAIFRPGAFHDIPALVRIHLALFPETVMARLGPDYLTDYYGRVLSFPGGIIIIAEDRGSVVGFVAGVVRPDRFYRSMLRNGWRMIGPLTRGLFRYPSLFGRVPYSVGRVLRSTPRPKGETSSELCLIAVEPRAAGRGIGRRLAFQFLQQSWDMGADLVRLTTDAEKNDATNGFYTALGFQVQRTFRQCRGCLTHEYVYFSSPRQTEF